MTDVKHPTQFIRADQPMSLPQCTVCSITSVLHITVGGAYSAAQERAIQYTFTIVLVSEPDNQSEHSENKSTRRIERTARANLNSAIHTDIFVAQSWEVLESH